MQRANLSVSQEIVVLRRRASSSTDEGLTLETSALQTGYGGSFYRDKKLRISTCIRGTKQ